jgi:hypothetical protein
MNYDDIFKISWRGLYDGRYGMSESDMNFIRASKAVTYNDLYNEAIILKKNELQRGGTPLPFYEPSTFYGSYREAHRHDDYKHAASRYASNLYSTYSRFQKHSAKGERPVPSPITEPVKELWIMINKKSELEPWAWPMTQLHDGWYTNEYIQAGQIPVIRNIYEAYIASGFTQENFFASLQKIRELTKY